METNLSIPILPTLEDVARVAGVSTATVSRSLNSPNSVAKNTLLRVKSAVDQLGYSPNFGARALAAKRTNAVGAVIPTMENAIFARGLQAFQETLFENGSTLLVASSSYQREREEVQIRSLIAGGADAILLIGEDRREGIYEFLKKRGIPYVLAWNFRQDSDHCFVGFDNRAAAREMAIKVLKLGHTKIGMIAGLTLENDRARDRVTGVREAISEFNISERDFCLKEAQYDFTSAGDAVETLLENGPRPTAIICGNDILAIGATKRLKSLGLCVPQDISITGFDDIEVSSIIEPELTTVHIPHREMGKIAAEQLLEMRRNQTMSSSIELKPFIVERQSLAKPPN
ncbi:MAG: substrate-binding domain-containing protein [Hyphomicrobiales bacterium]|nr:substrate-binding domain-containing protein [Hyphomicrobiales bacterium]